MYKKLVIVIHDVLLRELICYLHLAREPSKEVIVTEDIIEALTHFNDKDSAMIMDEGTALFINAQKIRESIFSAKGRCAVLLKYDIPRLNKEFRSHLSFVSKNAGLISLVDLFQSFNENRQYIDPRYRSVTSNPMSGQISQFPELENPDSTVYDLEVELDHTLNKLSKHVDVSQFARADDEPHIEFSDFSELDLA